jgi:predicted glycoside hydrolase/deacetylase ChbG (UPF0249 family)
MRKLIVNADDFGFNREVTDGILECHKNGCVTSTTLMAHMPAAEYAVEQSKKFPNLSVGIHLAINTGRPLSDPKKIPALVDSDGNFKSSSEIVRLAKRCRLPIEQVQREFTAQVERFLSFGITPTHCDGHQHITVNPQPLIAMMRVIKKYNIKRMRTYRGLYRLDKTCNFKFSNLLEMLRINTVRAPKSTYYELLHRFLQLRGYRLPDMKCGFYKVVSSSPLNYDLNGWAALLKNLPDGVCELVVHPGLPSSDPMDREEFRKVRVLEYELLSSPRTKKLCEEFGVELVNFNVL